MRVVLAALTLALVPPTPPVEAPRGSDQVAQLARDVSAAVRKQRVERRARNQQKHQSTEEKRR
jgi:predicted amidophosphoribosyltransferase